MTRHALEKGYVLHSRPYRETSVLLEVLTREHGRIGLVGRGVRTSKRSRVQAFQPLRLSWSRRGDLGTLTGSESDGNAMRLSGDRMMAGLYVNELVVRLLTRDDPNQQIYDSYHDTLMGLASDADVEPLLRGFERGLLEESGYGLQLTHDYDTGEPVTAGVQYSFDIELGPRRVLQQGRADMMISGDSLLALTSGQWASREQLREAKRLLRAAIRRQLGATPLHTPSLMQELTLLKQTAVDLPIQKQ